MGTLVPEWWRRDTRRLTGSDDWRVRFRPDLTNRILVLLHVRPRGRAYRD